MDEPGGAWLAQGSALRPVLFVATLVGLAVLERVWPRRATPMQRALRWPANLGLGLVDAALLVLMPLVALDAALQARAAGWGLFNQLAWPPLVEGVVVLLILDAAIYAQHRLLHEIRWLWPLHRPHHTDIEFDVTTALRFHPFEIAGSLLYKLVLIALLGAPPLAVLLFETLLGLFSLFTHANLRLPARLDRVLRWLLVTPDVHRAHHSVHRAETDSNYGTILLVWDRLFGSYTPAPRDGHDAMQIGLPERREPAAQKLLPLLAQPLQP